MARTVLFLAGLGAALLASGFAAARGHTVSDFDQTPWVERHTVDVPGGRVFRLDGCLTVTGPGLEYVSLRITWYDQEGAQGFVVKREELPGNPWLVGSEQCLALTGAAAPCATRSAHYGVVVKGPPGLVDISILEFSPEEQAPPLPCPTPTPISPPAPTASPRPGPATPAPTTVPTAAPTASSHEPHTTPTAQPSAEPKVFPWLVNGSFEDVRDDGTPYGWRKVGGEMSTTGAVRAEGNRAAVLASRTESTKWLYQTVAVDSGSYYRMQAKALKNDPAVKEALLRISWYESADGSGSQLSAADSQTVIANSPAFTELDTGPVRAPPAAKSAKVRLLMRPAAASPVTLYFDDVRFAETVAAPVESARSAGERAHDGPPDAPAASLRSGEQPAGPPAALDAWAGRTPLANVSREARSEDVAASSGGRPSWPLLLALGVPVAALIVAAGHAWWKARLAGVKERNL